MPDIVYTMIGLIGMGCFLGAYFLLQCGRLTADGLAYSVINLLGAVLILVSFVVSWNLPAFLLEVAWGLISIYGIIKYYRKRKA